MCGINGIFAYHYAASSVDRDELRRTREYMHKRGPDGCGEWFSADDQVGFGHRRLAIIDLDSRADQPMTSSCGRFVIVFNGEIYNYRELRQTLIQQGAQLHTQSDTEVLLALYARDGAAMFAQLRGMYALAIFDRHSGQLLLARDPHGIKPLYVADDGWTLRFASSVKALLAGGRVSRALEPAAQVGFLLFGSVPEPWTWHSAIRALPAGHYCVVDSAGPNVPVDHAHLQRCFVPGPSDANLDTMVRDAVHDSVLAHQIADVPVGVFLSAGIDSGALLGIAASQQPGAISAVTLSFEAFTGTPADEAPLAAAVAAHYGAAQQLHRVGQAEFAQLWPQFLSDMDQPSIDGLNTWLVSRAAHQSGLKVVLSGVGGDELLAGYPSFHAAPRLRRWLAVPAHLPGLPSLSRWLMAPLAQLTGLHPKTAGLLALGRTLAGCYLLQRGLLLPHELHTLLPTEVVREGLYRLQWQAHMQLELDALKAPPITHIGWLESSRYLRNQLLRDTDWAGMAHSLEIRTPLVDVSMTARLAPLLPLCSTGRGKRALARSPERALPDAIVQRAKTGFQTPLSSWQENLPELRGWRRHQSLLPAHTPWARRYAATLLELCG